MSEECVLNLSPLSPEVPDVPDEPSTPLMPDVPLEPVPPPPVPPVAIKSDKLVPERYKLLAYTALIGVPLVPISIVEPEGTF